MHSFQLLCSLLLCNALVVAAQRKLQKVPEQEEQEEEENITRIRMPQTLSRGWGDEIEWVQTYEEALTRSRNSKKPLMVIHHLEECPYSQALKKAFVSSPEIQKMAQEDFIMLNLVHSSTDDNMAPDGHYVPRILFVDPSMTVRADLTGKYKNRMYAYEPEDISNLIENMRRAKTLLHTEL
ncbi:anterior gradient protein 3-like isoform X1 [Malaclemys terrapin pileata]|uniref:anterior gradient protein 3-like n=1 Tax=Emys orbicularis TaxID=82168 RepID=UPI0023A7C72F|nr:anterior gradient protein 3-like isoform X1 [Malaclemys terrapin pileata]